MPKVIPFNPFAEMRVATQESLLDDTAFRLSRMLEKGWNPAIGSVCKTSSGRRYFYGPSFILRINQWQMFVLGTRNKRFGRIFHYSHIEDQGPTPWTDFVDRYRVTAPLNDIQAIWLSSLVNTLPVSTAIIFSGTLLSDLLAWADRSNVKLKRDVVFTTFEPFPLKRQALLNAAFDDWCDYMRSWEGGLTFWRCQHGTYHTMDNISIMDRGVEPDSALMTDLSNYAQKFVRHETSDRIRFSDDYKTCECGVIHRDFEMIGSSSWDMVAKDGSKCKIVESMNDIPAGYQVYQPEKGKVILLSPTGEVPDNDLTDPIRKLQSNAKFTIDVAKGYVRRRDKIPPIYSGAASGRRYKVLSGGYEPPVNHQFEEIV